DAAVRRGRHLALLHERGGTGRQGRVQAEAAAGLRQVPAPPVTSGQAQREVAGLLDGMRAFAIPMRTRFRGITVREGALIQGPAGWGEVSPFAEYGPGGCRGGLAGAVGAAAPGWPAPVGDRVPVNVTVPAVDPARAHALVTASGCRTAKVKVAERGQSLADDVARVEAVRDALGSGGAVRGDANGAWDVGAAGRALRGLGALGPEYAQQPCAPPPRPAEPRPQNDAPPAARPVNRPP